MADVISKFLLVVASIIVFFIITIWLLIHPSWPLASVEMILSYSIGSVMKHYFPAKKGTGKDGK